MEEILCIGCGATIQTTDKAGLGYPSRHLKRFGDWRSLLPTLFPSPCYNEITDVQLTDDDFLNLLHEVGDSDALVVNVIDIFDALAHHPRLTTFCIERDILLVE